MNIDRRWTWMSALCLALMALGLKAAPTWACGSGVICVDADATGAATGLSWTNAYTNVQDALSTAGAGMEIWVAEGVYYPDEGGGQNAGDRNASFFLRDGVALYGGFAGTEIQRADRDWTAHATVLSGNLGDPGLVDDNSEHVVTGSGRDGSTVLDGFTVSDGKAFNPSKEGGGIYIYNGSPTLANLVVQDNYAGHSGGGIYNHGGSPSLTNVTFDNNRTFYQHGGGMYTRSGNPTLTNVTFSLNQSGDDGGGLYTTDGAPQLTNVTFTDNWVDAGIGGGMHVENGTPQLDEVIFSGNEARWGGGLSVTGGTPGLRNLTFDGNVAVGGGAAAGSGGGFYVLASDLTLSDATFSGNEAHDAPSGSGTGAGGGMTINNCNPTLVNVTLNGNTATKGGGLHTNGRSLLANVVLGNNVATNTGGGILNHGGSMTLVNTTLSGNSAGVSGGGIYNDGATAYNPYLHIRNTILWGNTAPTGPQLINVVGDSVGMQITVSYSDVEGSGGSGAGWDTALGSDGGGNLDVDPRLDTSLRLDATSPVIDVGDDALLPADSADLDGDGDTAEPLSQDIDGDARILYEAVDMGADEYLTPVWYVDDDGDPGNDCTSWADACPDLWTTLHDLVASGDEVWVAAGTYTPGPSGSPRTRAFQLQDGAGVYGGFAGNETSREQRDPATNLSLLSGDLDGSGDWSAADAYHVVDASGVGGATVLDGFTISGGNADYGYSVNSYGGGLYLLDGSPVLTNLVFRGNFASEGGGLYAEGSGTPTITDVLFTGNDAQWGGGMYNAAGSLPTLAKLTFSSNSATYGGGLYIDGSNPTLADATFWDNASSGGGGIFVNEGSPTLVNVTVSGNDALYWGGGIYNQRSAPTFVNTIVWGNSAPTSPAMFHDLESAPTLNHSIIEGCGGSGAGWDEALGTDGGGNLDADPRFVGATGGDLRLSHLSPAIDAGNSLSATTSTDLAGNPRIMGDAVDMGAYEVEQNDLAVGGAGTWLDFGPEVCARVWFTAGTGTLPSSLAITLTHETPSINGDGLARRYEIVAEGGNGYEARLTLCYEDDELVQAGIDPAQEPNLHAYHYVGSPVWAEYSTVDPVEDTVIASGVTTFGVWGLGIAGDHPTAVGGLRLATQQNPWPWLTLGLVAWVLLWRVKDLLREATCSWVSEVRGYLPSR